MFENYMLLINSLSFNNSVDTFNDLANLSLLKVDHLLWIASQNSGKSGTTSLLLFNVV